MNTPKFKKGDWIKRKKDGRIARIVMLLKTCYDLILTDGDCWWLDYDYQDNWELTDAPPKNKLEEVAKNYTDSSEWLIGENLEHIEAAFIAGAEWQKEQDNYDTIFHKGMMYYRKQMMEEAVEGLMAYEPHLRKVIIDLHDIPNGTWNGSGTLVDVIIIKKEDAK